MTVRVRTRPLQPVALTPLQESVKSRFELGQWVTVAEAEAARILPPRGYSQFCQFYVREAGQPLSVYEIKMQHKTCGFVGYDSTLVAPSAQVAAAMFVHVNPDYHVTGVEKTNAKPTSLRV